MFDVYVRSSVCVRARARVRLSPPPRPSRARFTPRPPGRLRRRVTRCAARFTVPFCRRPYHCTAAHGETNAGTAIACRMVKNTPRTHGEPETGQSYHSPVRCSWVFDAPHYPVLVCVCVVDGMTDPYGWDGAIEGVVNHGRFVRKNYFSVRLPRCYGRNFEFQKRTRI